MDLQFPDRKMSTTGGSPQGTVYVTDEPDAIVKKFRSAVTDSGTEIVRAPDKAGISNLIEILAAVQGELARRGRRPRSTARVTGRSSRPWPTPWSSTWPRSGSATRALRADEAALERILATVPRRPARSPRTRCSTSARRWESDRSGPGSSLPPMRIADLELDLDVFAGPFDLLLTLILREEIDLLEVDLAEVVISYIDHLERRGELELEAATEFLVLIAALLELKSRLLLPGRGDRGADRARSGRGGRGAPGPAARRPPLPGRRQPPA